MIFLFKQVIFRFHVNFPGCNTKTWKSHHLAKHPKPLQTRTILPSKGITLELACVGDRTFVSLRIHGNDRITSSMSMCTVQMFLEIFEMLALVI